MIDHEEYPDSDSPVSPGQPAVAPGPTEMPLETTVPVAAIEPAHVSPLAGDPLAVAVPYGKPRKILPEDLRVSWSWPHFLVFLFFGFASLMVVQLGFVFYVSANRHLTAKQVEK
ncbi:MAG TPA: hypothetical protein VIM00_13785, partial [Candidatus Acidoferrum sp.]